MVINSVIVDSNGRQYSRDSFDRFGDDLTELILSFMSFEDKTRLQFVCRQWQRCIFEKTSEVRIVKESKLMKICRRITRFEKSSNTRAMISCLKNCRNVRRVTLENVRNFEALPMIGRYCPHIRSLDYRVTDVKALSFFRDYGHKLEELDLYSDEKHVKQFLDFCPNLKKIRVNCPEILLTEDNEFLPQLEQVKSRLLISYENIDKFNTFTNKYSQTLKYLFVQIDVLNGQLMTTCVDCICRLENLQKLYLTINYCENSESVDCLSLIGQNCAKLLTFYLVINFKVAISDRFFDIFTDFKAVKRLKISLQPYPWDFGQPYQRKLIGSVECFKHCKQLTELVIDYPLIEEQFFAFIRVFVPKLQTLKIVNEIFFSKLFIKLFRTMKCIRKVSHLYFDRLLHRDYNWYFGKYLSEVMASPKRNRVIRVNDNCGLLVVKNVPRKYVHQNFDYDFNIDVRDYYVVGAPLVVPIF